MQLILAADHGTMVNGVSFHSRSEGSLFAVAALNDPLAGETNALSGE